VIFGVSDPLPLAAVPLFKGDIGTRIYLFSLKNLCIIPLEKGDIGTRIYLFSLKNCAMSPLKRGTLEPASTCSA
jgi:hypothetical protein